MTGNKNILIAGTGAIGGYFGAHLALNKNLNVCFLSRGKALEYYKKHPLQIHSTNHKDIKVKIKVSDNVSLFKTKFDYVFVCVKSKDTESLIPEITKVIKKKTQIVTLQNGLYNLRILKEHFGSNRCLQAICKIGAEVDDNFVIQHTSLGFMVIGEEKGKPGKRIFALEELLKSSGIKVKVSENFLKEVWIKFAWNSIFNTYTGLNNVTVDKLFATKGARKDVEDFYDEIKEIAASEGIILDDEAYKKVITDTENLGKFKTSAFQDLQKHKKLETDYFVSELLRIAKANNVKTIITSKLNSLTSSQNINADL